MKGVRLAELKGNAHFAQAGSSVVRLRIGMATGSITSASTATLMIFSQNPVFDISGIATRPLRSKASSYVISHLDSRW